MLHRALNLSAIQLQSNALAIPNSNQSKIFPVNSFPSRFYPGQPGYLTAQPARNHRFRRFDLIFFNQINLREYSYFGEGVILSEGAFQPQRRISQHKIRRGETAVRREILRPAGENAGLQDDARM